MALTHSLNAAGGVRVQIEIVLDQGQEILDGPTSQHPLEEMAPRVAVRAV
jgi:hypothetical protein